MPEINISAEFLQTVQSFGLAIISYLAVLWLALGFWAFSDIRARTRNWIGIILGTLLVLCGGLPGLLVYLLLRPRETVAQAYERSLEEEALLQDIEERSVCPSCRRRVKDDYLLCPHCDTRLKEPCARCARPLAPQWRTCPYCASPNQRRAAAPAVGASPAAAGSATEPA